MTTIQTILLLTLLYYLAVLQRGLPDHRRAILHLRPQARKTRTGTGGP